MPDPAAVRAELRSLRRAIPFEPFIITLGGGERVVVRHPENVAYDPKEDGSARLYIISGKLGVFTNLDAVTALTRLDRGQDS